MGWEASSFGEWAGVVWVACFPIHWNLIWKSNNANHSQRDKLILWDEETVSYAKESALLCCKCRLYNNVETLGICFNNNNSHSKHISSRSSSDDSVYLLQYHQCISANSPAQESGEMLHQQQQRSGTSERASEWTYEQNEMALVFLIEICELTCVKRTTMTRAIHNNMWVFFECYCPVNNSLPKFAWKRGAEKRQRDGDRM